MNHIFFLVAKKKNRNHNFILKRIFVTTIYQGLTVCVKAELDLGWSHHFYPQCMGATEIILGLFGVEFEDSRL